jgi:drug/metabolite transporter (DMT)-like permease
MRKLGASRGTVYNNLIPVFSLMLALVIGQERFNWLQAVGMLVVLVGLTIAQRKKSVAADGVA